MDLKILIYPKRMMSKTMIFQICLYQYKKFKRFVRYRHADFTIYYNLELNKSDYEWLFKKAFLSELANIGGSNFDSIGLPKVIIQNMREWHYATHDVFPKVTRVSPEKAQPFYDRVIAETIENKIILTNSELRKYTIADFLFDSDGELIMRLSKSESSVQYLSIDVKEVRF